MGFKIQTNFQSQQCYANETEKGLGWRYFPGGPVVKALPSNAGDDRGLTPGGGAKIAHVSWPKTQNISSRSNTVTNSINT